MHKQLRPVILFLPFIITFFFFSAHNNAQTGIRREIAFPDILGLQTLKCDFHMHTVFSDGHVWPTVRIEEAWQEGLDCIAITDHIDYQPYSRDVSTRRNRSYELAISRARELNILLVRGGELTCTMPPGHFNMIFIRDVDLLANDHYMNTLLEAKKQQGFIFWNHPSFPHPRGIEEWFSQHDEIYNKGLMMGIEVANGNNYYPNAHQWALDKGLTMMGNSDSHGPMNMSYDFAKGEHRPITLVFARARSLAAIKEALFNRRTAVYWKKRLIGEEKYLQSLFKGSIKPLFPIVVFQNNKARLQIHNSAAINYHLGASSHDNGLKISKNLIAYAHRTIRYSIESGRQLPPGLNTYKVPCQVKNLWIVPEKGLESDITFRGYSLDHFFLNAGLGDNKHCYQLKPEKSEKDILIRYTLGGLEPGLESTLASVPFRPKNPFILTYRAFFNDTPLGPPVQKKGYVHLACGKKVLLKHLNSPSYPGGGSYALSDGFLGSENHQDGSWVGFAGVDMLATLDLGKLFKVNTLSLHFLQNINSWIFLPQQVKILFSKDGKHYQQVRVKRFKATKNDQKKTIKALKFKLGQPVIRYIKVEAQSIGQCPSWHSGAGQKAWLFVDEIIVE